MRLKFEIASGDFSQAGRASSRIKKVLKQLQVDAKVIKRIVVAVYEAEVNVVAHSLGGQIIAEVSNNCIEITVQDCGPGIKDVEQAMQEGFSTASKEVRNMGFGAGMGLPNIKRNTDELSILSSAEKGTTLKIKNDLNG